MKTFALTSLSALIFCGSAQAADINVAVAANFTAPMKDIAAVYEKETGNKVLASFGATGQFLRRLKTERLIRSYLPQMLKRLRKSKTKASVLRAALNLTRTEN